MGPSNLSLAMLQRCTIPRQDYFLRVHKPAATLKIAECFDAEISRIISHWFLATGDSLRLATLPQKMGGLGLTQSTLKQRYFFEAARRSIDEHKISTKAPVGQQAVEKVSGVTLNPMKRKTKASKAIREEQTKVLSEIKANKRLSEVISRTKDSNSHLVSTNDYIG